MTYHQTTTIHEERDFSAAHSAGRQSVDEIPHSEATEVTDPPSDELSDQTNSRRLYLFGLSTALRRVSPGEDHCDDE
jgi:hypothetical protein